MTFTYQKTIELLKAHLADYRPYLERAIAAVNILETADPESEEFSDALAELHVSATVLEPYSEGMVEAIDQYTEDLPDDEEDEKGV
jgi:DNA-directed RNA polymerase specialized sigma54-like protein